jgi:hypothetical protein
MSHPQKTSPTSDDIQLALGGKIHQKAITILQGIAKALREGRRITDRWLMIFAKVQRSWFYELKRQLRFAGYWDEDGSIYLPTAEETQAEISRWVFAMVSKARQRQPAGGTVQRSLTESIYKKEEKMAEMVAKHGPEFANLPDRVRVCELNSGNWLT